MFIFVPIINHKNIIMSKFKENKDLIKKINEKVLEYENGYHAVHDFTDMTWEIEGEVEFPFEDNIIFVEPHIAGNIANYRPETRWQPAEWEEVEDYRDIQVTVFDKDYTILEQFAL